MDKLEFLNVENTQITDISFLEKNENLKELIISGCNDKNYKFKRKIKIMYY